MDISGMRRDYQGSELTEEATPLEPLPLFEAWFAEATQTDGLDPNAMTLATVGADGRPSTRIVLVKSFDENGLVFFTNFDSRKGRELAANPHAALQFHWPQLDRVVRIEGDVEKVDDATSEAYFASRPRPSQVSAWASPQSSPVASRLELEQLEGAAAARFGDEVPRPGNWGGYRLVPEAWEFWQGRQSRLHDRLRWTRSEAGWDRVRLAP